MSRSFILVQIDFLYTTSYRLSVLTFALWGTVFATIHRLPIGNSWTVNRFEIWQDDWSALTMNTHGRPHGAAGSRPAASTLSYLCFNCSTEFYDICQADWPQPARSCPTRGQRVSVTRHLFTTCFQRVEMDTGKDHIRASTRAEIMHSVGCAYLPAIFRSRPEPGRQTNAATGDLIKFVQRQKTLPSSRVISWFVWLSRFHLDGNAFSLNKPRSLPHESVRVNCRLVLWVPTRLLHD